jgi:hypothetical protein
VWYFWERVKDWSLKSQSQSPGSRPTGVEVEVKLDDSRKRLMKKLSIAPSVTPKGYRQRVTFLPAKASYKGCYKI